MFYNRRSTAHADGSSVQHVALSRSELATPSSGLRGLHRSLEANSLTFTERDQGNIKSKLSALESERNLAVLTEQLCLGLGLASGSSAAGRRRGHAEASEEVKVDDRSGRSSESDDQRPSSNGCTIAIGECDARLKPDQTGTCSICCKSIRNKSEGCTALGRNYHTRCFTCCACGRTLKGKPFYWLRDKAYCEEDYKYTGFQQMGEHCRACGQLILDVVLQAVGQSFHPGCFRCQACGKCLDGESFTLDASGSPLCVSDYHRLYAPMCASCKTAIVPIQGSDETVRVVALGNDYHIDCYHCLDCGMQLTDEPEQRCYPLDDMLLCRRCHVLRRSRDPLYDSKSDYASGANAEGFL